MSYEKYYPGGWQSGETGGTPITPEALNHIEEGLQKTYEDFAPNGYGLGAFVAPLVDSWNDAKGTGYFRSSRGGPVDYEEWHGFNVYRNEDAFDQIVFKSVSDLTSLCVRKYRNGGFEEWEWVNPPMVLGKKYRTTERWKDKPVYTTLLNGGPANNNIYISLDPGCQIIRDTGWLNTSLIPYGQKDGVWYARTDRFDNSAYLYCSEGFVNSGYIWTHQFWYVEG